jgi:hypothetical protein
MYNFHDFLISRHQMTNEFQVKKLTNLNNDSLTFGYWKDSAFETLNLIQLKFIPKQKMQHKFRDIAMSGGQGSFQESFLVDDSNYWPILLKVMADHNCN